ISTAPARTKEQWFRRPGGGCFFCAGERAAGAGSVVSGGAVRGRRMRRMRRVGAGPTDAAGADLQKMISAHF
ncbi:hypothetical protein, partial [Eubacterium pyruvativorans]|uniref:hypothetical protein n=1 Tax=Eubacterium pyruvativorans TaxID=155865 RepID=UPI0023F0D80A